MDTEHIPEEPHTFPIFIINSNSKESNNIPINSTLYKSFFNKLKRILDFLIIRLPLLLITLIISAVLLCILILIKLSIGPIWYLIIYYKNIKISNKRKEAISNYCKKKVFKIIFSVIYSFSFWYLITYYYNSIK